MSTSYKKKATVILPTTTDRGVLLPFSVGSVLQQTLSDVEIFIIGDGINEDTRNIIQQIISEDSRVKLFDHPKHPRRGEVYRHTALQEATGEIVAYICDRDLWLPTHLEQLYTILGGHDFATTNHFDVSREQRLSIGAKLHGYGTILDTDKPSVRLGAHKLSSVGHTLKSYHSLPEGWRTTPMDQATDRYMWRQFLQQKGLKINHSPKPTFLYFKRGGHPGMPTASREKELALWWATMQRPQEWENMKAKAYGNFISDVAELRAKQKSPILVRGQLPSNFIFDIPNKIRNYWRNRNKKPFQW